MLLKDSVAMLVAKRSKDVALRDESEESCHVQVMGHASERIRPGFETQGRRHPRSKTGVFVVP